MKIVSNSKCVNFYCGPKVWLQLTLRHFTLTVTIHLAHLVLCNLMRFCIKFYRKNIIFTKFASIIVLIFGKMKILQHNCILLPYKQYVARQIHYL